MICEKVKKQFCKLLVSTILCILLRCRRIVVAVCSLFLHAILASFCLQCTLYVHACSVFWRSLLMCLYVCMSVLFGIVFFFFNFVHIEKKRIACCRDKHWKCEQHKYTSNNNQIECRRINWTDCEWQNTFTREKKSEKKPCIMIFVSIYICVSNRLLWTIFFLVSFFSCRNLFSNEGLTLFRSCM